MEKNNKYNNLEERLKIYFYTNEKGYRVFTEKYHLERGFCCKNNCKHCPYGYNMNTGGFEKSSTS